MRIEHAGGEQTGTAHMREQARDDVGIVDESAETPAPACSRCSSSPSACTSARGPPGKAESGCGSMKSITATRVSSSMK